ncbi:cuticle protein 16.8-like [Cherax quadricarinatus]
MAAVQLFLVTLVGVVSAAPQFEVDPNEPPTPYDFGYGVYIEETGDAKEHKESVSPSGRTEGEYRWLQPNGLFRVVRYYVDGDSGFQAQVSEEPGPDVVNYYTNSLSQETSSGTAASQGLAKSIDVGQSTLGIAANLISARQPSRSRPASLKPAQTFQSQQQSFSRQQSFRNQQSFNSQQGSFGNVIDGGIIDGGIIDGGIIDGGIIDGGFIN